MPNLGNRIPDNPNGILCSANELKSTKSNPNCILYSASELKSAGSNQIGIIFIQMLCAYAVVRYTL